MKHYLAGLQFVLGDLEADATVSVAPGVFIEQPAAVAVAN
jgi:hypothetical protein